MNKTEQKSPHSLQDGETNLSSWTVKFDRVLLGWTWSAEHADGTAAGPSMPAIFVKKEHAEHDAVKTLTRIESGADHEEVGGFDLQIRVRERGAQT